MKKDLWSMSGVTENSGANSENTGFKSWFWTFHKHFIVPRLSVDICKIMKIPFEDETCCLMTGKMFHLLPKFFGRNAV